SCGLEKFDGTNDNYVVFRDQARSVLRSSPFLSGNAQLELIFQLLKGGPLLYARRESAAVGLYELPPGVAIERLVAILDSRYDTPQARRGALRVWESLRQTPSETVRQYTARFEEARGLYEDREGKAIADEVLTVKFSNGLTSTAGIAARSIADPMVDRSFEEYVRTVNAYALTFESEAKQVFSKDQASATARSSPTTRTQLMFGDLSEAQ
ncbi:hypothetical protein FOZ62_018061, partial [Perkinsus olseni]